jgi:glutamate-1-semialdehyde 2,1-aminomutase
VLHTREPSARTNADIHTALIDARSRYVSRNQRSFLQHQKACEVMPGGNTRSILFHTPFPLTIVGGKGCRIEDADGHTYVDYLGEFTAGMFGHSHPEIRSAVIKVLDGGINLSGHNMLEAAFAKSICDRFPSIERIRFTNSGTEANLMAVATAIAFTGRKKVLAFKGGYHGGLLSFGEHASPVNAPYDLVLVEYNDTETVEQLLDREGSQFAAILVEPMLGAGGCITAEAEFLRCLRNKASRHGAVLIFDEVMTSRLAPGGLQKSYGIAADMTTLGKYIGGGLSFGAFGGRAEILDLYDPRRPSAFQHAGTFNNNILTMSAGLVAMTRIFTVEACTALNARGDALRNKLNSLTISHGLALQFIGMGSLMTAHFSSVPVTRPSHAWAGDAKLKELFYFDMLERGQFMARRAMTALSLEIGDAECVSFIDSVSEFIEVRQALIPRL